VSLVSLHNGDTKGWAARERRRGEVFFAFRLFLLARIDEFKPRFLIMEAPFLPRPDRSAAAQALNPAVLRRAYGLAAYITGIAEEYALCCFEKQSTEVAKFFTGKGRFPGQTADERTRAKKQAVMAACWARGWKCRHDDEADALALLCCFEAELYPDKHCGGRRCSLAGRYMAELVLYDEMCRAITAAHGVDEVKDIRDKAPAIEIYSRQARNIENKRRAIEIRIRAERRCGELLAEMEKAKGSAQQEYRERTHAGAKATHDICGNDGQNALWQAHAPMDRRSLGVLTSDSPELCRAIGTMEADHRRKEKHGDRPGRRDPSLHPAADTRAADGWVRQPAPGLQDRGLIPFRRRLPRTGKPRPRIGVFGR